MRKVGKEQLYFNSYKRRTKQKKNTHFQNASHSLRNAKKCVLLVKIRFIFFIHIPRRVTNLQVITVLIEFIIYFWRFASTESIHIFFFFWILLAFFFLSPPSPLSRYQFKKRASNLLLNIRLKMIWCLSFCIHRTIDAAWIS